MRIYVKILLLTIVFSTSFGAAQSIRNPKVLDGVKAFYLADFSGARTILQDALLNSRLSNDDQFAALVYIAFSLLREEIEVETAKMYLRRAIETAPDIQLDTGRIPPDLYNTYSEIRMQLIGSLSITTDPPDASAVLVDPVRNRAKSLRTPGVFENLLEGEYNLFIKRHGSSSFSTVIRLAAGEHQSLEVALKEKKLTFVQKYWPYGAGVIAAGAILAAILGGGEPPSQAVELPMPPAHPQ